MSDQLSLLYTDDEESLIASVHALVEKHAPLLELPRRSEEEGFGQDLDDLLVGSGLSTSLPDRSGSDDALGWAEAMAVAEAFGHGVAPVPLLGLYVTAAAHEVLQDERAHPADSQLLLSFDRWEPRTVVEQDGLLTGTVAYAVDADRCGSLLVPVAGSEGVELWSVASADAELLPLAMLDRTRRLFDVGLHGAAGERVAQGSAARDALAAARLTGSVIVANELVGVAERALEIAVDHARTRQQFGRPIGSFQALQQKLADAWTGQTVARSVARYAAQCLHERDDDAEIAAAMALVTCAESTVTVTELLIQVLGGMGFTWEHPAHLLLKRAVLDAKAFGGVALAKDRLGGQLGL